jgi:hypothetical protein
LETGPDEEISSDNESELDEDTGAADITFGQNHKIHGILVVSSLSQEISVI